MSGRNGAEPGPERGASAGRADDPRSRAVALLEGARLHKLLVESVRDYAIFALDATGHVLTWNPGAQRFKGYEAHEIIGRHFSTFYPPDDIAAGKPAWELEVARGRGKARRRGMEAPKGRLAVLGERRHHGLA